MATAKPDLTRVWASGAPGGNVIDPDVTTPGKVAAGWQAEVPPFEHFNFLQKWFTQGLAHLNEQGVATWDSATVYPLQALVKGSNGLLYESLTGSNQGNDPVSSPAEWILFSNRFPVKIGDISQLSSIDFTVYPADQLFEVTSYHPGWAVLANYQPSGGGMFVLTTGRHDGGNFISTTRSWPNWFDSAQVTAWFLNSGSNEPCLKRVQTSMAVPITNFGALGTVLMSNIASGFDSTQSFIKAYNACIENQESDDMGGTEKTWAVPCVIPKGNFKITSPLLNDLGGQMENVTVQGVGPMARLIYSPSAVVANARLQAALFNMTDVRYGKIGGFSVLGDFLKPGHAFDMGECRHTKFHDLRINITAGLLAQNVSNNDIKYFYPENIVYAFRWQTGTVNSIINVWRDVRIGDAGGLNNGVFTGGTEAVIGWGDDPALTGGTIVLNRSVWKDCVVESQFTGMRFQDTSAENCTVDVIYEGNNNQYVLFPELVADSLPQYADLTGNVLTSATAIGAEDTALWVEQYVHLIDTNQFRKIVSVDGGAGTITVDYNFDADTSTNGEYRVVRSPQLELTGFSGSRINAYIETSLGSPTTYRLSHDAMILRNCGMNIIHGFYDSDVALINSRQNQINGRLNGLHITGRESDGNYGNEVNNVRVSEAAWGLKGVTVTDSTDNVVKYARNGTNDARLGRDGVILPMNVDAARDINKVTLLAPAASNLIYLTDDWTVSGAAMVGDYLIEVDLYDDTTHQQTGSSWAIVHNTEGGDVTIPTSFSSTGTFSISPGTSGTSSVSLDLAPVDKTLQVNVRRNGARQSVYGV